MNTDANPKQQGSDAFANRKKHTTRPKGSKLTPITKLKDGYCLNPDIYDFGRHIHVQRKEVHAPQGGPPPCNCIFDTEHKSPKQPLLIEGFDENRAKQIAPANQMKNNQWRKLEKAQAKTPLCKHYQTGIINGNGATKQTIKKHGRVKMGPLEPEWRSDASSFFLAEKDTRAARKHARSAVGRDAKQAVESLV